MVLDDQLSDDLNYLNMAELRVLCRQHDIPTRIYETKADGRLAATRSEDRKRIILRRIRHYLKTGEIPAATVLERGVCVAPVAAGLPKPDDLLTYGAYGKHRPVIDLLRSLTGGKFRDGARARIMLMDHWTAGHRPTYAEFAAQWLADEGAKASLVSPEYAYLTDLQNGMADADWKEHRNARAARAIQKLAALGL